MAFIRKQLLGEVTGTLGDTIFRKRYGKTVVYSRPSKYRISKSKAAKQGRNSFALSVAFAKSVNSIPELKQIWYLAKLQGVVAYNRVIKYNKGFIINDSLTTKNIITPPGVDLFISDLQFSENILNFKIDLNHTPLKMLLQVPFHLSYLLYFYNPINTINKPFEIVSQTNIIESIPNSDFIEVEIKLKIVAQQIISEYKNIIIYLAGSKFSSKKKEIFWTNTVAIELQLGK